jgi:signal transduction histidine kinase
MRKILLILLIFAAATCSAQSVYSDSLKNLLANTSSPISRFDLINKILESQINNGENIDTSLCIALVQLAHDLNNDSLLAIGYNMAGSYTARKGDYPTSLEYVFKAIPLAEKAKDSRRISSLYFDISLVYIILNNLKEAYYYNLKGKENLPDKSNKLYDFMAAQFDRNMVRYYLLSNNPDSALPYLQQLEQEGNKLKIPVIRLPSLFLSGATYARLNKMDSAEFYFKAAVRFSDSISSLSLGLKWTNDKYYIPYLLNNGRNQEAKIRAFNLLKLGDAYHNPDVSLTAAGFLRAIYDQSHQSDSAYYFSRVELSMKDSVFSENNRNKEQALAFNEKLRGIEEQRQIEIRKKQNEQNLLLGTIGFCIIFLVLLFTYQLRKRRREMENKLAIQRERISRELHDNVGSQLTYISGNIDWLIDSKNFLSKEEEIRKLSVVSEASKSIVNDLRETIWVIKKESITLEELSDRLKSLLQEQIALFPDMDVEIIEDIKKDYRFQPTESLNTYRICQEALNNSVKHALASKIILKIFSDAEKNYYFSIADNGKGFDPQIKKEGHYGVENMQQRAKETGAALTIQSIPGKGTTIILQKHA